MPLNVTRREAIAGFLAAGIVPAFPIGAMAQSSSTLTAALTTGVNTLDPHMTLSIGSDLSVIFHVHVSLVTMAPNGDVLPYAAKSFKMVDPTTWNFVLHDNITFSNGEKLDSAAVKWNFERVLDKKTAARVAPWFTALKEVQIVSPVEFNLKLSEVSNGLLKNLGSLFILPPEWAKTTNPANAAVGAGPYELTNVVPGERFVLKRREWFGPKPAFETVIFRVIPDQGARIAALQTGEVDIATGIAPSEVARLNTEGRVFADGILSTRSMMIKYNMLKEPFKSNKKLRQALNYAIDKQAIVDSIWSGYGAVSNGQIMTPNYFGYNTDLKPYAYDPEKAKALIKEAGIAPGSVTLELDVPVAVYLQGEEIAQALAAQIEEVGIKVKITEMDFGNFMTKYLKTRDLAGMSYFGQGVPTFDGNRLLSQFEKNNQYAFWEDDVFTGLIVKARAEPNEQEQLKLYNQATERMRDEAPMVFLFAQPIIYGRSKRISWQARADDWIRATEVKLV